MTIKEIANAAGIGIRTVTRKVKELYPAKIENGKTTILSEKESIAVMESLRKLNFVVPGQNDEVVTRSELKEFAKEIVKETLQALIPFIQQNNQRQITFAPQLEPSQNINKIVREYAQRNNVDFRTIWQKLYTEFGYRTHTNPTTCAKNREMPTIEYIKSEGMIDVLEAVAIELFK